MFLQKQSRTDRHGEGKVSCTYQLWDCSVLLVFSLIPLVTIPIHPPLRYSEACQRHDQHTDKFHSQDFFLQCYSCRRRNCSVPTCSFCRKKLARATAPALFTALNLRAAWLCLQLKTTAHVTATCSEELVIQGLTDTVS